MLYYFNLKAEESFSNMRNNQLTNLRIGFALHGYENDILSWLSMMTMLFEGADFPLKSVSYDINYSRRERKSLKTFYKTIQDNPTFPIDKAYSFSVFAAEKQNIPITWHYGCNFDMPSKMLILFFDTCYDEANILSFYKKCLQALLKDKAAQSGYLFYQPRHYDYPLGYDITQGYYKEDGRKWAELTQRKKIHDTLNKKNMYRHIYKQNVLSKYHLEEHFDNLTLTEWIDKNNYGNIEKIGIESWLWTVPEEKLNEIQMFFYNKHLLLGVE
jgi:hypothetical protein